VSIEGFKLKRIIIRSKQTEISRLRREVDSCAKSVIPDFNPVFHFVGEFWDCDKSPCGVCVFDKETRACLFCSGGVDRK